MSEGGHPHATRAPGRVSPGSSHLQVFIATACCIGYLRPGPGTWATIASGGAAGIMCALVPVQFLTSALIAASVLALIAGLACSRAAIERFQRKDPSQVVIDEVAGTWIAVAIIPAATLHALPMLGIGLAMLWFRVFDIAKPWPIYCLEHLPGAWGIMLDDVAAGVLAGLVSTALLY